jgi:electron transport complex protein RnfG
MNILKPGIVLFLIGDITAALLGFVNQITLEPIAQVEQQTKDASRAAVLECAQWGDEVPVEDENSIVTAYTPGLDENGEVKGYAVAVTTKGFSAGLKLMFGISAEDGSITGLSVVDCSNETPGLGANAGNDSYYGEGQGWYSQFAGKVGELKVSKNGIDSVNDDEISAITGATITSTAVTKAANEVQTFYESNIKEGTN